VKRSSLRRRVARLRPGEAGLTLIELLVSLALLAVLTGFLAGGLVMGRRALAADRVAGQGGETDAAIEVVARLVGSALPAAAVGEGLEGRADSISFVGLSEGHALGGGPYKFSLRRNGLDVIVEAAPLLTGADHRDSPSQANAVVLTGVRAVRFGYFGKANTAAASGWRSDWHGIDHLPDLVSIQIDFEDERRNEPAVLVALRQG
jgi:prepilin-type N-terminal cleavage/methylation domain-containing protein